MQQIQDVHDKLISGSNDLLEPHALADLSENSTHRIFAKSVLLMMRIASSVAGDDEVLDTANCRTLDLYEADFLADVEHQAELWTALEKTISLSREEIEEIECEILGDIAQADRKHKVVRAIRDYFGLWKDNSELRSNVFRFFNAIYPDVGIEVNEVELIVTGTMIFFCLPFTKDELTSQRYQALTEQQRQPIRDFLRRVNRFSQWQFAHFPVFGFRRGSDLSDTLLAELATRSQLTVVEVAHELSTLTSVIPLAELDKYVVHDIWGHSWQACMLGFDHLYEELAEYADFLDIDESAGGSSGTNGAGRFADCFVGDGAELVLDEEAFRRFVDLEVAERLPIAMTPVLAEVLADVAEFKLVASGQTGELSTSSALGKFPAKLDLTMRDVIYYFRQATKVFRLWSQRADRRQRTVDQLIARGTPSEVAGNAVARAAAIWNELEQQWLAPEIAFRVEDGVLRTNVVTRLALNFLAIHRETLTVYHRIGQMSLGKLPVKGLRDLMLISVAVFFEEAPSKNLWRVDEFLSQRMEPLCRLLVENS